MLTQANLRSKEMKQAAYDFSEGMLRSTEETVAVLALVFFYKEKVLAKSPGTPILGTRPSKNAAGKKSGRPPAAPNRRTGPGHWPPRSRTEGC